jgi:AcrR family transcriptional regulator
MNMGDGDKVIAAGTRTRGLRQRREQQRATETREKIIEAAEHEFANLGYEGASTREIARQAGVQHTMISYHFASKDGLWQAVVDKLSGTFIALQRTRLEGLRGVDPKTQLRLLLEEFIRYSAANLNLHKIMTMAAASSSPRLDAIVSDYLASYFKMIANLIQEVQEKDGFVKGDPNHLHYLFIGAATRIFMQSPEVARITGRSPLDPDFVDQHVNLCLSLFFLDD